MSSFRLGENEEVRHTAGDISMKKLLRRHLSLMLALRYLNPLRTMFSVITLICLMGVALGVMVLIVVLSVMSGLQREMETRVLAFTPHYVVSYHEGAQRAVLTEEATEWPKIIERIKTLPGVVTAYPQLESESVAQAGQARMSCVFRAIDSSDANQMEALKPLLRYGTFDFGAGLDEQAVLSAQTANALGVTVGDTIHLTPIGNMDEVARIYALIQKPLATQKNTNFMEEVRAVAGRTITGTATVSGKEIASLRGYIRQFRREDLRDSEYDELCSLWEVLESMDSNGVADEETIALSPEEQKAWKKSADALASLDRDKEDGRAVKNINEFIMPVDLEIIGIYQPPENMPGPAVFVPLEIGQQMMGFNTDGNNAVQGIAVRVQDPNNSGSLPEQIYHCLPPEVMPSAEKPYGTFWGITSWQKSFETWFRLIANERTMMSFVLSTIALIAAFCIMAVMFTMSMQRKREIAVMQALGATPAAIMRIFIWQGVIIGCVGAVLGVALALLVLHYRLEIQTFLAGVGLDPFPMEAHGIVLPCHIEPRVLIHQALQAFIMVTIASTVPAFFVARQDSSKTLRSN